MSGEKSRAVNQESQEAMLRREQWGRGPQGRDAPGRPKYWEMFAQFSPEDTGQGFEAT